MKIGDSVWHIHFTLSGQVDFSGVVDQKLYQSKDALDKWLKKFISGVPPYLKRVEFIAEEVISGQWVEIDRWNN